GAIGSGKARRHRAGQRNRLCPALNHRHQRRRQRQRQAQEIVSPAVALVTHDALLAVRRSRRRRGRKRRQQHADRDAARAAPRQQQQQQQREAKPRRASRRPGEESPCAALRHLGAARQQTRHPRRARVEGLRARRRRAARRRRGRRRRGCRRIRGHGREQEAHEEALPWWRSVAAALTAANALLFVVSLFVWGHANGVARRGARYGGEDARAPTGFGGGARWGWEQEE
ncbi:hypothetical protein BKA80DRAFT_344869, partial [Phyllosticta citrichinensis]